MKKITVILVIACLLLYLSACGEKEAENDSFKSNVHDDLVEGIKPFYDNGAFASYGDGLLYGQDGLLKVYDFSTKERYVLCGNTNCKHFGNDCAAWFGDNSMGVFGAALYNGKVYYFQKDDKDIKLHSQDVTGEQQKVLYKMDLTDVKVGSYTFVDIVRAIYHNGYVWVEAIYDAIKDKSGNDSVETKVIQGINLETGDRIELSTLPKVVDEDASEYSEIEYIGDGVVIVGNITPLGNNVSREAYILYDIESKSTKEIYKSELISILDEDGNYNGELPELQFFGKYKDKYVCTKYYDENVNGNDGKFDIYLFDTDKKTFELVTDGIDGFPFFENRYSMKSLIDGSKLIYEVSKDDKSEIYYYDLEKNESKLAFTDEKNLKYRLVEETEDKLIFKIYTNVETDSSFNIYTISKEDYLKGKFENKEEFSIK
ncbi:TolB-like translocation protein [Acetitomaculum ruminis]|nr:hypothetical protein [Acetitomaculum ruminis]